MDPEIDLVSDLMDGTADLENGGVQEPQQQVEQKPAEAKPVQDKQRKEPAKSVSLRDQISSAIKGEDFTPPVAQHGDTRPRNPDGTFASPAAVALTVEGAQAPAGTQPSSPVQVPAGVDATLFNALPAEMQVTLARTMEDIGTRQARLIGHEQIEQLIAPRRQAWALNGMSEAQAVNQLFALSDFASTDPKGFITYFSQQTGVNLEDIVFGEDPGNPEINTLKQQIAELQSQLGGFQTQQQTAAHQSTVNEVVDFFSQKDDTGAPLRPYAEELGESILPFIQAVLQQNPSMPRAQVLQQAYDNACWGNASIRAKMQETGNAVAEAARIKALQEKAGRAKTAASSVAPGVPTSPAPSPSDGSMNLRDTIRSSIALASQ